MLVLYSSDGDYILRKVQELNVTLIRDEGDVSEIPADYLKCLSSPGNEPQNRKSSLTLS